MLGSVSRSMFAVGVMLVSIDQVHAQQEAEASVTWQIHKSVVNTGQVDGTILSNEPAKRVPFGVEPGFAYRLEVCAKRPSDFRPVLHIKAPDDQWDGPFTLGKRSRIALRWNEESARRLELFVSSEYPGEAGEVDISITKTLPLKFELTSQRSLRRDGGVDIDIAADPDRKRYSYGVYRWTVPSSGPYFSQILDRDQGCFLFAFDSNGQQLIPIYSSRLQGTYAAWEGVKGSDVWLVAVVCGKESRQLSIRTQKAVRIPRDRSTYKVTLSRSQFPTPISNEEDLCFVPICVDVRNRALGKSSELKLSSDKFFSELALIPERRLGGDVMRLEGFEDEAHIELRLEPKGGDSGFLLLQGRPGTKVELRYKSTSNSDSKRCWMCDGKGSTINGNCGACQGQGETRW